MLHIFFIFAICATCEKKPRKTCKNFLSLLSPIAPLSIWESTTHRSLSFFLNKMRFRNTFCYKSMESFQIGFLFLINFRHFKWGIKERFQLLTLPCILIFKEILLQLRALKMGTIWCIFCSVVIAVLWCTSFICQVICSILSDGINTDCLNALFSFTYTIFKLIKQLQ